MSYPRPLPGDDTGRWRRLQELKPRINAKHRACNDAVRTTLEHAIQCGELLERAKVDAGHGNWERWRDEHFEGSKSTAQLYQNLWSNRDLLLDAKTQRVRDLSLREARKIISGLPEGDDSEDKPSGGTSEEGAKKGGTKKGPGKPGRCDPPEAVTYNARDLPVPKSGFSDALREGRALALDSEVPVFDEESINAVESFLAGAALAVWAGGHGARLYIRCEPMPESEATAQDAVEGVPTKEASNEEATQAQIEEYERRVIREVGKERDDRSLHQIIIEQGGIKPPSKKGPVEEYREIPSCYKRKDGLAGDEMADYLGMYYPQFGIFCENDLIEHFARRRRERAA